MMSRVIMFCLMLSCMMLVMPATAKAAPDASTDNTVAFVLCNIVQQLSGPISQAIATLVIIITGYSFFVGKVSIGMLFIVAAGIMFVFGAQTILGWILGSSYQCKSGVVKTPVKG